MNIEIAASRWIAYRAQLAALGALAPSTLRNNGKIIALWARELPIELIELRKSHVDVALARLRRDRAPVTLANDMAVLAQFLNWCADEQLIPARPRLPSVSVPQIERDLPSDAAFLWILKHTPPRTALALEFMLLTGLAPHELERLEAGDYDRTRQSVGIGQRDDFAIKAAARKRWVPLNARAHAIWIQRTKGRDKTARAFPTVGAMEKAIQRARSGARDVPQGAETITPKVMRQWFASTLSDAVSEHVLQKLLGHAPGSKITRRHYVRSTAESTERAVDSLTLKEKGIA